VSSWRPLLVALAAFVVLTGQSPPSQGIERLEELLSGERGEAALWGVYIADANTGEVLYAHNGQRPMLPASNAKVLTAATALDAFGSNHRYRTPLLFKGARNGNVWRGDLILRGSGDPSFGSVVLDSARQDPLRRWADSLRALGVTRIEGRLIGDDDAGSDNPYGDGWDIDYVTEQGSIVIGVATSALAYHDNVVTLRFGTTARNGQGVEGVPAGYLRVENGTRASDRTSGSAISIRRVLGAEQVAIRGSLASGRGATVHVPVTNPAAMTAHAFRAALDSAGIAVDALRALDVDDLPEPLDRSDADTVFVHVSPPLSYLLEEVGHHSNNFYADQIFRSFGWAGTAEGAAARVQSFLQKTGAKAELVSLADGSGLSRLDYVTPEALARTLVYMKKHPEHTAFQNQLAYPGGGTTLGYRLSDLDVRAKTGSLEYARALSGYVVARSGRELAFSVIANNFAGSPLRVLATIDDLVRAAAEGL